MIVNLPDDTVVYAQGRLGLIPSDRVSQPDFAVYLDDRWNDDPEVKWPYRMIAWPDFGAPEDQSELFDVIVDIRARARSGEIVEIACYGGLGRTGTVLACLAVCAGVPCRDAVEWVRINYDQRAVETKEQCQIVEAFAQSL
ncbi:MAG TPA: protein-tyrosine phosphatase family protein [Acidimicrobiales bacterium]